MCKYLIFIIFFTLFTTTFLYAQWEPCNNGLPSYTIKSIAAKDSIIFISTNYSIFKSTDYGNNWVYVNQMGGIGYQPTLVLMDDSTLYSLDQYGDNGSGGALAISTDLGNSWKYGDIMFFNETYYVDSSRMYVCNFLISAHETKNNIYRISGNGDLIENIYNSSSSYEVFAIAAKNKKIIFHTSNGIYLSTDDGNVWQYKNSNFYARQITKFDIIGNYIFAGTNNKGIYISSDEGDNWYQSGLSSGNILTLSHNGENIFAGTENDGLYVSSDFGVTWVSKNSGLQSRTINTLTFNGNDILVGNGDRGLFLSKDKGDNWLNLNHEFIFTEINSLVSNNDKLYLCSDFGLFSSSDFGNHWQNISDSLLNQKYNYIAFDSNRIFLSTLKYSGEINISNDKDLIWINIFDSLSNHKVFSFAFKDGNIYAGTEKGVYFSTDNGDNWSAMGLDKHYIFYLINHKNIFYAIADYDFYISSDDGKNWIKQKVDASELKCLSFKGDTLLIGAYKALCISPDLGNNWEKVNNLELSYDIIAMTSNNDQLYISENYGSIFTSNDWGNSWTNISDGLPSKEWVGNSLCICGDYLFSGSNYGVYRARLSDFVNVEETHAINNNEFSVYPNPVLDRLNIKLCNIINYPVQICIYNIYGQKLREECLAPGNTEWNFIMGDLPSGTYFIQVNGSTEKIIKL